LDTSLTRRRFLETTAAGALATAATATIPLSIDLLAQGGLPGPRRRQVKPLLKNGRPLVVVVEGENPETMLAAGLDAIGGLGWLVHKGAPVVLKPNMVGPQPYPVTTDLITVFALVGHLRKAGCGEVTICDSPTQGGPRKDAGFEKNGYFEQGKAAGVTVVGIDNRSDADYLPVQWERWQLYREIRADRRLFDAPVVINLPTLKRHFLPGMTCALKNYFGAVHAGERNRAHQEARAGGAGLTFFKKAVAEFADSLRSELTIVDARALLIKGGPSLGTGPAEIKPGVNRMIFASDMVAVEAYGAQLLKTHDDTFSPAMADETLAYAQALGMGLADLKQVEIIEVTAR
jgi:uncharacterized protein (DUF362 family)